ncbi:MAG: cobalamin-binding protein [candidate division WOR-3 bacterium]|nr:MAG: cobalamin-binding protein [candidate division WOR-3 bacterium]
MLRISQITISHLPKSRILIIVTLLFFVVCTNTPEPGMRVVSLSPAMTEIIYALDADVSLVGVTTLCDYPPQARNKPKVGDFSNPSLERIMGMQPTLVIVHLPEQRRIQDQLERFDVNIFVSETRTLADIYAEIRKLGTLLNRSQQAESLVHTMQADLQPISPARRKRVYIELSPRPLITIGAGSFLNELIELAGGQNIFSDLDKDYPIVQQEEVIRRNPEVILVLHPVAVGSRSGWDNVDALKYDRVYADINQDHLMRPGPRLVEGFNTLREIVGE